MASTNKHKAKKALKQGPPEIKPPATMIRVICDTHFEVTREKDPDDPWSQDSRYGHSTILGISVSEDAADLTVYFPIKYGKVYYLVSVVYNTGDSFHTVDGCIEHVELFTDPDRAAAMAKAIADHAHSGKPSKELDLFTDSGAKYRGYVPWIGYFESFVEARVTPVALGAASFS